MTFSIIVPVHNAEKYIDETLASLDRQRSEASDYSFEVVLIENGSTDNSLQICDDFADNHSYTRSLHYGLIGAYEARREGIRQATGDWLLFVDADDILVDGALKIICDSLKELILQEADLEMLFYNAADTKSPDIRILSFPFEAGCIYKGQEKAQFYEVMCRNDSLNALWNKCVKRDMAYRCLDRNKVGVLSYGEDLLQTAAFLDEAKAISYIDRINYLYRDNCSGLTSSYNSNMLPNQKIAWGEFDKYADKWFGDKYKAIIDERKALTCSIVVKRIIYSNMPAKRMKSLLKEILSDPFIVKYGRGKLPDWAPEEDVFVHGLICDKNPYKVLLYSGIKSGAKAKIKRLLKHGL